jgi:hypothetical protein
LRRLLQFLKNRAGRVGGENEKEKDYEKEELAGTMQAKRPQISADETRMKTLQGEVESPPAHRRVRSSTPPGAAPFLRPICVSSASICG